MHLIEKCIFYCCAWRIELFINYCVHWIYTSWWNVLLRYSPVYCTGQGSCKDTESNRWRAKTLAWRRAIPVTNLSWSGRRLWQPCPPPHLLLHLYTRTHSHFKASSPWTINNLDSVLRCISVHLILYELCACALLNIMCGPTAILVKTELGFGWFWMLLMHLKC